MSASRWGAFDWKSVLGMAIMRGIMGMIPFRLKPETVLLNLHLLNRSRKPARPACLLAEQSV